MSGDEFYQTVAAWDTKKREALAAAEILSGNIPGRRLEFRQVRFDTIINGKKYRVKLFATTDYLSIGSNKNFARVPLTPGTAQLIADSFRCFLPTRKIVDLVYQSSKVKLKPMPMFAYRDSSVTMYQHHLIVEGLRQLRNGLISGIKKDVVMTARLKTAPGKVAIYGWHRENGQPIQPLYTEHIDKYVDYSHGIRLIHQTIIVNGKKMNYRDVFRDPLLRQIICDEPDCAPTKYPTALNESDK